MIAQINQRVLFLLKMITCLIYVTNQLSLQISIVSQEPVLFNCSIEENIAYGCDGKASSADVENAAVRHIIFTLQRSLLLKMWYLIILMTGIAENGQCT